jgi:endonuclease/exonuclease/phosphatase family metal-dependent hydrolase
MGVPGKLAVSANTAQIERLDEILKRPAELKYVSEFRIGTYNVHNLFGDREDVHSANPDPPSTPEHLHALGKMIVDLDADVIAFQEVQNEKILGKLFRTYVNPTLRKRGEDTFTTFVCVPARDPRGINVALATRLAVRGTLTFHDYEFGSLDDKAVRFSRDLLAVETFVTPKYRFLFFVAHLKSKLGGDPADEKRAIEASEIRELLEQPVFGGAPYIQQDLVLAGDMNDDPESTVIEILRGDPRNHGLCDLLEKTEPRFTYPTHTRRPKTQLDFMFASPSMVSRVTEVKIHREEPAAVASDHYPASATIQLEG